MLLRVFFILFFGTFFFNPLIAADEGSEDICVSDFVDAAFAARAQISSGDMKPVSIPRAPVHVSSFPGIPHIFVSFPGDGVDHVHLSMEPKFGFANATTPSANHTSTMIDGSLLPGYNLRSLDAIPGAGLMVASYTKGDDLMLSPAAILNLPGTPRLNPLPPENSSLLIRDLKDVDDGFVVSTRVASNELYITDSSKTLRIVRVIKPKPKEGEAVSAEEIRLELAHEKELEFSRWNSTLNGDIQGIEKIQFFGTSSHGYIRVRAGRNGNSSSFLVPFHADLDNQGNILQFHTDSEKAQPLQDSVLRTTAHPTEPLVFVAYENRFHVWRLDFDSGIWSHIASKTLEDFLDPGQSNLGVEFVLLRTDQGLVVKGILMAGSQTESRRETELIFVDIGE